LIIFAGAAADWFAKCAWFNRNVLVVERADLVGA
jgi:hypothetical protein